MTRPTPEPSGESAPRGAALLRRRRDLFARIIRAHQTLDEPTAGNVAEYVRGDSWGSGFVPRAWEAMIAEGLLRVRGGRLVVTRKGAAFAKREAS